MSKLQDDVLPYFQRTGGVKAEFDQGTTAEATTYPGGYCAGLTVHWMAQRAAGKNWPERQTSAEAVALSKAAAATYGKYKAGHDKAMAEATAVGVVARAIVGGLGGIDGNDVMQIRGALAAVVGDVNMTIDANATPTSWKSGDGAKFIHEVAVLGGGLYYISILCDKGSHALGLNVTNKAIESPCEFFDPNVGQLHFDKPEDLKWSFGALLRSYSKTLGFNFTSGHALRILPPQLKIAP
ncbi:MAG: hypothetical protein V4653_15235 [Pseudomonadota bacterium]